MKTFAVRLLAILSVAAGVNILVAAQTRQAKLSTYAAEAAVKEIRLARASSEKWLRSDPTSYLATISRCDFGEKTVLTVGRNADNDVRLDDPDIAAHHLRVSVEGDRFHVEAIDPGAGFRIKEASIRQATVDPTYVTVGRFILRLSHQRFPAIIVFDPKSPRFAGYKGLRYYPVNLAYRFELPLKVNLDPKTVVILSTRGNQRNAQLAGWFEFATNGTPCRLEAVRLLEPGVGEDSLMILFRDATTGKQTYPLGRYVDAKKLPNGNYLLDFNQAYSPACAFSEHYNCPIPPIANRLSVAIRAGEMDSHYH